jgi:uncharacterized repeat protein (TIGR03803 family)
MVIPSQAQFKTLVEFNKTTGYPPNAPLVQGLDGSLYGTTEQGGAYGGQYGGGTVFQFTTAGALTTLYNFCAEANCADGRFPSAGMILGTDGNFYGVTSAGGNYSSECQSWGCGTIFKITPQGTLTTLYSFCSQANCPDGQYPVSALVLGTDGDFYGTTRVGGAPSVADCFIGTGPQGCGTIFKISSQGTLTTIYSFCSQTNCSDGDFPGQLVLGVDGNLYGTTSYGGNNNAGTFFKFTPQGTMTTVYSFAEGSGATGVIQAADGNFYGTTITYFFKITPQGTLTTIAQGGSPDGQLLQATDGNFYGTTGYSLFKLTPSGSLTTLRNFKTGFPSGGVFQATNGIIYGTTAQRGKDGTIYRWLTRLGPFVKTLPTSGAAGTAVTILGTNLTGSSAVSFNGTAAAFTVVSDTEITTSVPAGSTTGTVTVTTPGGTLSSNVVFTIP